MRRPLGMALSRPGNNVAFLGTRPLILIWEQCCWERDPRESPIPPWERCCLYGNETLGLSYPALSPSLSLSLPLSLSLSLSPALSPLQETENQREAKKEAEKRGEEVDQAPTLKRQEHTKHMTHKPNEHTFLHSTNTLTRPRHTAQTTRRARS